MIFYFSATGNSKYVATRLSQATGEKAVSIADCLKHGTLAFEVPEKEKIGFVTPTYFWGLPTVVSEFLGRMRLTLSGSHYTYHVLTFGETTGQAHRMLGTALKRQGLSLDGQFIVQMVDTWTPMFDLSNQARNLEITAAAEPRIAEVIDRVKAETAGDFDDRKIPEPLSAALYLTYRTGRKTGKFAVTDACVGCGLCAKGCPVNAIEIRDGKPAWVKKRCALCLACLHHCPAFAIRYGKASANHGQFVNPNVFPEE